MGVVMKKLLLSTSCILFCCLFVGLSACNKAPDLNKSGVEITTVMGEMVNTEAFREMSGVSETQIELVKAKDYDTPTRVYKITTPTFDWFMQNMGDMEEEFNGLSDSLKEQVNKRYSFASVINMLNNQYGLDATILSSIFIASKTFDGKLESSVIYLYTFETGRAIAVSFEPFGEKQFTATGYFVFAEDLSSLSAVRDAFEPIGCTAEEVK